MACYHPLPAWRSNFSAFDRFARLFSKRGRRKIHFGVTPPWRFLGVEALRLPCGKCIGCRLERSRQWAVRCSHEMRYHDDGCFLTLTYAPEHLPEFTSPDGAPSVGVLDPSHLTKFLKDLRAWICRSSGCRIEKSCTGNCPKIRFFACGEYGEKFSRPHYHVCLFGFNFDDRFDFELGESGEECGRSTLAESLWKKGRVVVGDLTFESAAYVARYVTKKINGPLADDHYMNRVPEFLRMSRRGGIGREWFDEFSSDVYPSDQLVFKRREKTVVMRPPAFYDKIFKDLSPLVFLDISNRRSEKAKLLACDSTPDRLRVRELLQQLRFKKLRRAYENV